MKWEHKLQCVGNSDFDGFNDVCVWPALPTSYCVGLPQYTDHNKPEKSPSNRFLSTSIILEVSPK